LLCFAIKKEKNMATEKLITLSNLTTYNNKIKVEITNGDAALAQQINSLKEKLVTIVATKPTTGETGVIYLVGSKAPYHMWAWETISGTPTWVDLGPDLTGYASKSTVNALDTKVTNLTNEVTADKNNLANNYYTKTVADQKHGALDTKITNLTNDVATDKKNLADNYYTKTQVYTKTEVTDLHTGLESNFNEKYNSLSSEVTADKNNLKNNYYTKTQINTLHADMKKAAMTVVSTKPTTGEEGIIYLVGSAAPYHMWIWETISGTGTWIDLGTSTIDLSGYANKNDLDSYGKLDGTNTWTGSNAFVDGDSVISIVPATGLLSYYKGSNQYGININENGIKYVDSDGNKHTVVLDYKLTSELSNFVLKTDLTNTLKNYAKTSDLSNYGKLNASNRWTGTNIFTSTVTIENELNIASNSPGIAMINVSSGNMDPTRLTKKTVGNIVATKEYVDGLAPVYATEAEINALFA
jgi:hypothetical protein